MKQKIAIIGKGHVGSALERGLKGAGYETRMTGKGPDVQKTAAWGDVVIWAVPFGVSAALASELGGTLSGKVLVDVTNVLGAQGQLALGYTTSGAEELQKKVPAAKVVKAFNNVFAQNMASGTVQGQKIGCFVAADDAAAKSVVLQMARDIGFDAVDAGPLANARLLEPLGYLMIQIGYVINKGLGTAVGMSLTR
ncbi:MAG TPA: hypothetical protein VFH83_06850 [Spirochaetia bacterium]|nr:hypothetical protein [Spirochaetia bacterium]